MGNHTVHDGKPQARGSGRTTRQIEDAPLGAVFVWCTEGRPLPAIEIARRCKRPDLIIVGREVLQRLMELNSLAGRRFPAVILDHSLADEGLDPREMDFYRRLLSMVRP